MYAATFTLMGQCCTNLSLKKALLNERVKRKLCPDLITVFQLPIHVQSLIMAFKFGFRISGKIALTVVLDAK